VLLGGTGGHTIGSCFSSGVDCLCRSSGGAHCALCLQCVRGIFAVPCCQERQPSNGLPRSIRGGYFITAVTCVLPGMFNLRCFSSQTLRRSFLIRYCVSSIVTCQTPHLSVSAILNPRHMSDCSSCTRPPCLATVVELLKTYMQLVAAFAYPIWQIPQPYIPL